MERSTVHKITLLAISCLLVLVMSTIAQPDAYAAIKRGQPAPPIKVTTTSGQSVSLANYKGYVLILDFFASWCHPCVESIPHIVDLKKRYGKQGLQVLGLSLDEDKDDCMDLMSASRVNYPVALADEELQTNYGLRSIPLLVLIDKKGNVANIYMGLTRETTRSLETEIQKLLTE